MSLDETKFSRIAVTNDDEDDVVIHAGARPEPAQQPASSGGSPQDDALSDGLDAQRPDEPEAAPASAAPAGGRKPDKGYRETTAEDLEPLPMSLTQKVVVALAALLIVGAVAYYFVFMR